MRNALAGFWPIARHNVAPTPDSAPVGAVDAPEQAVGDTEQQTITLHVHGSAGVAHGKADCDTGSDGAGFNCGGIAGSGCQVFYSLPLPSGAHLVGVSVAYQAGPGAVLADLDVFTAGGGRLAHWHPVAGGAETLSFQLAEPITITDGLALAVTVVFVALTPTPTKRPRQHINQHWATITGVSVTITV